MRFYSFTNFYLSSIQQGIQPAHCVADMFVKYAAECTERTILLDWATNHKTMICLNGGNSEGVRFVYAELEKLGGAIQLPFVKFHEDQQSLDGALTSCAIIVPQSIYDAAAKLRASRDVMSELGICADLSPEQRDLAYILNGYGLAK